MPGPRARVRAWLVLGAQVNCVGHAGARSLDEFVRLERFARGLSRVRATPVMTQRCIDTWMDDGGERRREGQAPQRGQALQRKG